MTHWRQMSWRRQNRRDFGGRWQDRIPLRLPDPRHGEPLHHYCKRIGYRRDELATLSRKSGGDRIWRDVDDLHAWFMEIGYISPFFYWNGVKQTGTMKRLTELAERGVEIVEHSLVTFKDF